MKKFIFIIFDFFIRTLYPSKFNSKIKQNLLKFMGAKVGSNPIIDLGVIIRSPKKLELGSNVVISSYTVITAGGGIEIEDDVMIGYNCNILSQNHIIPTDLTQSIRYSGHEFKKVIIKKGAWLASNVTVLPGITIGEGAVIAAGSVVTKDVEANSIYAGIPARKMRNR